MSNRSYQPHHILLRDTERTGAFQRAIDAVVKPGDVVIDLGAGTGILSLFAARAGARKVMSIELDATLCGMIANMSADNGFTDIIEPTCAHSRHFVADERADVLICDAMGFFGISEELDAFFELRDRVLRAGARLVPETVRLFAAPVEAADIYAWLDLGTSDRYDLILREAACASIAGVYAVKIDRTNLLAAPRLAGTIDMRTASSSTSCFDLGFKIERPGIMHGLAGWFEADLGAGHILRSGPFTDRPMSRSRLFVAPRPEAVRSGDLVEFDVHACPSLSFWRHRTNSGDWIAQSSLVADPGWRRLSFADRAWPARLPELCLQAVQDGSLGVELPNGVPGDAEQLRQILAAAVRDQHGGAFTGLR